MKKTILVFGGITVALLLLFRISSFTYLSGNVGIEIIIASIALVFFFIGLYFNKKQHKIVTESTTIDHQKIKELNLSKREYEVLCQIVKGLSNKEIADTLFVSESTVKTHVSNLLLKLDAKRRTEAIKISKELKIIPF